MPDAGKPSSTWSQSIEDAQSEDCDDWNINPIPPQESSGITIIGEIPIVVVEEPVNTHTISIIPTPYKSVTLSGTAYTVTGVDEHYVVEFIGSGMTQCIIPLDIDGDFVDGQETTLVCSVAFTMVCPSGVIINNYAGPASFEVGSLSDGVMMKKIGANKWLALGDAIYGG